MNLVILKGNLGRDPELKHTKSGTPVVSLSVATNGREKKGEEWIDAVEWHRVTVWGKQAEHCAKYLQKGRQVLVRGRLKTESYEKDGVKKWETKIIAEPFGVDFIGKAGASDAGGSSRGAGPVDAALSSSFGPGDYTVTNEEIPF